MKVGDMVFIVSTSDRDNRLTGNQKVTKVGRKYFEIESTPWDKFLVDTEKGEHPTGYSLNRGVRTKDAYSSELSWYPSKEAYDKFMKASAARNYISKRLHLMDDDEAIDFAKLLAGREAEYVVRGK